MIRKHLLIPTFGRPWIVAVVGRWVTARQIDRAYRAAMATRPACPFCGAVGDDVELVDLDDDDGPAWCCGACDQSWTHRALRICD